MIAYNRQWLNNIFVRQEVQNAYDLGCVTAGEVTTINAAQPVQFYTPNIFVRVGLFILTTIILIFSFGLLALMFFSIIERFAGGLAIFFAAIGFAALEFMIKTKKHFQSGVDDALLWAAAISLCAGILLINEPGSTAVATVVFLVALACTLRYVDTMMAAIAFLALLAVFFFVCSGFGNSGKAALPFVMMLLSAITYLVVSKINRKPSFNEYHNCLTVIEIVSLITLYAAGNYAVVRELSNEVFGLNLPAGAAIPFATLFWIFTIVIPVVYLFAGIMKKDVILIRVGLLITAALVLTVRYYYPIATVELEITIAGSLLLLFAWWLSRYLAIPRNGFTAKEPGAGNMTDHLQLESLIVAETLSAQPSSAAATKFGGGDFGGGGASGDF